MHSRFRIAPHLLEFVKLPGFRMHHMYHHVHIIDQHPLGRRPALMFVRQFAALFFYLVFHRVGNGFYLGGIGGFTHDEEIGGCFRYLSKVQAHNILALLILYGFDDCFEDFRTARQPANRPFLTGL